MKKGWVARGPWRGRRAKAVCFIELGLKCVKDFIDGLIFKMILLQCSNKALLHSSGKKPKAQKPKYKPSAIIYYLLHNKLLSPANMYHTGNAGNCVYPKTITNTLSKPGSKLRRKNLFETLLSKTQSCDICMYMSALVFVQLLKMDGILRDRCLIVTTSWIWLCSQCKQ